MSNTSQNGTRYGVQFHIQSQNIDFVEWIALFTICLAPLIAHVIAGVPKLVYLQVQRPRWHDSIVLYHPSTIVWRYFAITNRRIKASTFSLTDMAASNVLFWTSHGWDGSEAIMRSTQKLCVRPAPRVLERLISSDTLKTVIVALQGISAIVFTINLSFAESEWALDTLFLPLAMTGIWRLPAAYWLTEDHAFAHWTDLQRLSTNEPNPHIFDDSTSQIQLPLLSMKSQPRSDLYDAPIEFDARSNPYLLPVEYNPRPNSDNTQIASIYTRHDRTVALLSFILTAFYILSICGAFALCMYLMLGFPGVFSLTSWWLASVYALLLIVTLGLFLFYSTVGRSSARSTILPCAGTLWYKVYCGFSNVLFLVLVILAALETRKRPCGPYTTSYGSN